ncbi:CynX/NimT family MFS transporter [Thalassospira sp. TSL5-1]|uniref:MFS transporter n=1 Tax=Thalassospira sp. TSL5-1 TaxID=1544451 RepID=UPI0009391F35|nr:MFS transporter [Thalassospira sp. TSL5-1]OKH88877.1 MFS transporter [Thalassospira sp. TSL5-1]
MRAFLPIVFLYGTGLCASMQVGLVGPIANMLRGQFDLSQAEFGLVASLITAAGALCALPAGIWAARLGLKQAVIAGAVTMALGALVFSQADHVAFLYIGRFLTSIGYLLIVVSAPSWMTHLGDRRVVALAMGLWGTFVPVGIALGTWISAGLSAWLGWRVAVMGCALPGLVFILPLMLRTAPAREGFSRSLTNGIMGVLRDKNALAVSLTFAIFGGTTSATVAFMPAMLMERLDIGLTLAATIIGVTTIIGNIGGSLLGGILLGRNVQGRLLLLIGLPLMAVSIAIIYSASGLITVMIVLCAFNVGQGIVAGTCFALLPRIAGKTLSMPALQGMLAQFAEIFVVIIPPVSGLIIDDFSWSGAAFAFALFYLLAMIIAGKRISIMA